MIITSSFFDNNDNLFLIVNNKGDRNSNTRIIRMTDKSEEEYDIRLIKKAAINKDNVNLTRSGKKYDFKFGRLITDDNSFYTLFLRNDICYQIIMNVEKPISSVFLDILNSYEKQPTFMEFLKIIENVLSDTDLIDKKYEIASYEHFERKIHIKNEEKKHKELKLDINNSKVLDNESN